MKHESEIHIFWWEYWIRKKNILTYKLILEEKYTEHFEEMAVHEEFLWIPQRLLKNTQYKLLAQLACSQNVTAVISFYLLLLRQLKGDLTFSQWPKKWWQIFWGLDSSPFCRFHGSCFVSCWQYGSDFWLSWSVTYEVIRLSFLLNSVPRLFINHVV